MARCAGSETGREADSPLREREDPARRGAAGTTAPGHAPRPAGRTPRPSRREGRPAERAPPMASAGDDRDRAGAPEDPVEEIERSGASVEEAIDNALRDLGVSEQEARISIVQEPRSGFLGIAAQPAVVRVALQTPTGEASDREEAPDAEVDEQADIGADFLEGLLEVMGLD